MTGHTPGPWFAENGDDDWQIWHDNGVAHIAVVSRGVEPDASGKANAKLMAAAPDLLAACEQSLINHACHGCLACRQIRAAIDKAKS